MPRTYLTATNRYHSPRIFSDWSSCWGPGALGGRVSDWAHCISSDSFPYDNGNIILEDLEKAPCRSNHSTPDHTCVLRCNLSTRSCLFPSESSATWVGDLTVRTDNLRNRRNLDNQKR